jgi:hypothetical protein
VGTVRDRLGGVLCLDDTPASVDGRLQIARLLRRRRITRPPTRVIHLKVALPSIGDHEGDRTTYTCRDSESNFQNIEGYANI